MTIRRTSGDLHGVTSGFNTDDIPDEFIQACGVGDVDRALFNVFDKEIKFEVNHGKKITSVPIIFAGSEKWAQMKLNKPIRDNDGTLILPLIVIHRKDITQTAEDITTRGINQHTGDITIKRQLSKKDRAYQNIINKLNLPNQDNLPSKQNPTGKVSTTRRTGDDAMDPDIIQGALLKPDLNGRSIYEFITIPQPQFFTAHYEFTIWTKYVVEMNQIIEKLMSSFLPQGLCLKLSSPKGYWFIAYFDGVSTNADNFDDTSGDERVIKYSFQATVPGYTIASKNPGDSAPVRRFLSLPEIQFSTVIGSDGKSDADLFLGADDPTLLMPLEGDALPSPVVSATQTNTIYTTRVVQNPFGGADQIQYLRVVAGKSSFGESVSIPDDNLFIDDLGDV